MATHAEAFAAAVREQVARLVSTFGADAEEVASSGVHRTWKPSPDVAYAVGFLQGAARAHNMTVLEFVDSLGLSFEVTQVTRPARRRAPAAAIVHVECKTTADLRWLKGMITKFPSVAKLTDIGIEVTDRAKFDKWLGSIGGLVTQEIG